MIEELISALGTEAAGEALSALCSLAKTKAGREEIEKELNGRTVLYGLLDSDSPKVRKNAYRLVGALEDLRDAEELEKALDREETLFAVPSLLLALGNLGAEEAIRVYEVPASTGPETDKHIALIASAKNKALERFEKSEREPVSRLDAPREILCFAPKGFGKELRTELGKLGLPGKTDGDAVRIVTDDIERVYRADCLTEALIPVADNVPLDPGSIAKAARECEGKRYRIELRGYLKNRSGFIEKLKGKLPGVNSPSNYDWELRIECRNDTADLFWKLWNVKDERYPWRENTIPASIHPATASALALHAKRFTGDGPISVLDPFAGSGSLLFACEKELDSEALLGVDISGKAVETARRNAKAAGSRAKFVCKDILKFHVKSGSDLVISNLPFGNRVGSHKENETLYAGFINKLPVLLNENGAAVLYTAEWRLLEELAGRNHKLRIVSSFQTEAGGLYPRVFVIRKAGEEQMEQ